LGPVFIAELPVPKNRSLIIIAVSLAVLLGTQCGFPDLPIRYRFVLPDNYVGWVRIDFGISSAPDWRFDQLTTTVTIPEIGVEQSNLEMFRLNPKEQVFLYYQRGGDLVSVPDEFYSHLLAPYYLFVSRKRASDKVKKGSWYFFVGPASLKGPYSAKAVWGPRDKVPTPGRITAPEAQPPPAPSPNP